MQKAATSPRSRYSIEVEGLRKAYGPVAALDDVSFRVESGAIVGLLGGNGAGKTTTIAILLGLVLASGGTVRILGIDAFAERTRVQPLMNFESPYVDMPLRITVRQNLTVYGHLYGVEDLKGASRRWSASWSSARSSTARPASCRRARRRG
jgi:ABC-2 type transport system ATP-binding protein